MDIINKSSDLISGEYNMKLAFINDRPTVGIVNKINYV